MIPANFWERVDMSGGAYACWPWMGARTRGALICDECVGLANEIIAKEGLAK